MMQTFITSLLMRDPAFWDPTVCHMADERTNAGGAGGDGGDTSDPDKPDGGTRGSQDRGDRTYTKADVDRMMRDRLDRYKRTTEQTAVEAARQEAIEAFRSEHGLTDDILHAIPGQDEAAREMRRLKAEHANATKALEALKASHDAVHAQLREVLTHDRVISIASKRAINPHQVWLNLQQRLDIEADSKGRYAVICKGDDGQIDPTLSVDGLVENVLTTEPYLARPSGNQAGSGTRLGDGKNGDKKPDYRDQKERLEAMRKDPVIQGIFGRR